MIVLSQSEDKRIYFFWLRIYHNDSSQQKYILFWNLYLSTLFKIEARGCLMLAGLDLGLEYKKKKTIRRM